MATALNEHIVSSYEDELLNLNRAISEMGGMVEQSITDAANALLKLDHKSAQDVRLYDKRIDEMKDRNNDMAVSIIARRQPDGRRPPHGGDRHPGRQRSRAHRRHGQAAGQAHHADRQPRSLRRKSTMASST